MENFSQARLIRSIALVVDDLPSIRWIVVKRLKELGFTEVIEASDADIAMEKLIVNTDKGEPVSLIISDLQMPEVDGISFAKLVRSFPEYQQIPFIMLANESHVVEDNFQEVGEVSIIPKPISENFKNAVSQVLEDAKTLPVSYDETVIIYRYG
jgi:two-component system, chemotaxis family, chemotaxis protein CheY